MQVSEKLKPEDYLGMEVVVPVGANTEWYGTAIAFRDEPSVMIQTEGGLRLMLPADRVRLAHQLPKPWHDAKPGEVWAVAMTDIPGTLPLTVVELRDGIFFKDPTDDVHILVTGQIDSARRIWPEAVES